MPLDINLFRTEGGNPELIRESQRRRFASVEVVDEIIEKDNKWRFMTGHIDNLRKSRNAVQKEIGAKMKAKETCPELVEKAKGLLDEIAKAEEDQKALKVEIDKMVGKIGNIVDDTVPISQDEDADNRIERKWGVPRDPAGLLNHADLLWRIGGYEPDRGSNVAGHRGYFLKDVGVLLNQAFIAYGTAFLRNRGYTALQPPFMMKKDVMAGVAQLEQFDEELYKVGGDGDDKYLIATSEQPICAYHKDEWMDEKALPIRYAGISTCFRKEAGSHGKDNWGIFRVHQFEKVEQFAIVEGDLAVSQAMQEEMIKTAEEFYQSLGFPYHVINIVSGALNNAAIRKLDLECWFPGYNAYRELVSCSNCTDYQSRSMEIRCGGKKMGDREKKYVHMLNATLCATGRAICCLLETYQEADGVRVPEVLVPFMGGMTFMPFVRDAKPPTAGGKAAAAKAEKAPAAPKAAAPAPAPKATPAPAAAAPVAAPVTPAATGISSMETVSAALPVAPAPAEKKSTEEQQPPPKEKKAKKEKKPDLSKPPAVPILPPSYVSPAPVPTTPAPTAASATAAPTATATVKVAIIKPSKPVPTEAEVVVNGAVDLAALDARLAFYSYVGGFLPTVADRSTLQVVVADQIDAKVHMNVARWHRNVSSFTAEEVAAWV